MRRGTRCRAPGAMALVPKPIRELFQLENGSLRRSAAELASPGERGNGEGGTPGDSRVCAAVGPRARASRNAMETYTSPVPAGSPGSQPGLGHPDDRQCHRHLVESNLLGLFGVFWYTPKCLAAIRSIY